MTYRPTVRYPDEYKNYVDEVYKSTNLDRNQIIRLALFVAAHSPEFKSILKKHQTADVILPSPGWRIDEDGFWKEQNYIKKHDPPQTKIIEINGIRIEIG